jgi:SHS2 domain-containing protein
MVVKKKDFEYIDHTADIGIRAYGESLEEAFSNTAKAMFLLMAKNNNIEPKESRDIELESDDIIFLFKKWLEELLYYFESDKLIFSKFELKIKISDGLYRLKATVYGEKYNPDKHGSGVEIKAVTYHMMDVGRSESGYYTQVIFDI